MKKILILFMSLLFISGSVYAQAEENNVYNKISFDTIELTNDGTSEYSGSYDGECGRVYFQSQIKQGISTVDAKSSDMKFEGSSLSDGNTDKAAEIYVQAESSSNSYFALSLDTSKNMYDEGKLMLAFNVYVAGYSGSSHAPIQVDIRKNKDNMASLLAFRSSGLIQTYSDAVTADMKLSYSKGQWYYIQFIFDTEKKTYTLFINGEEKETDHNIYNSSLVFAGDPNGGNIISEIRFSVNNGQKSTGTRVQVDDIYFGAVPGEKVYDFEVKKLSISNESGNAEVIYSSDKKIYSKADITYAANAQNQKINTAIAMYRNGRLERVSTASKDYSQLETGGKDTIMAEMTLEDTDIDEDCYFKAFAWNNVTPMTVSKKAQGCKYIEYLGENPVIYLVSDSICMDYAEKYYPQQGWGYMFKNYVKDNVTVVNRAIGGRSTKSFIGEGRWDGVVRDGYSASGQIGVMNEINPGDYVILGMGHNDNNTSDSTKYTTIDEYKDYLRKYIDDTKSKGAGIVFVTSITQAGSGNSESVFKNTLLTRADAMKEVAEEKGVVCLDVNALTFAEFTELGWQNTVYAYFMAKRALMDEYGLTEDDLENHPNQNLHAEKGGSDLTHVTEKGADLIAKRTAQLLGDTDSPLKAILKDDDTLESDTSDKTMNGRIKYNLYPEGKNKALTFSFDDGKVTDREVAALMNRQELKATFNIVPAWLDDSKSEFLTSAEIAEVFEGHEIASHGNTHSRIETQTPLEYSIDLLSSRTALQKLTDYKVRGYAAPFGGITNTVEIPLITKARMKECMRECGLTYARLTGMSSDFELPSDFYEWKMQIRAGKDKNTENAFEMLDTFVNQEKKDTPQVMMIFAHGHEIGEYTLNGKTETGWELFEKLCENASGHEDIWYATCIEIADYINAVRSVTTEGNKLINNSEIDIWVEIDDAPVKVSAGESFEIKD